MSTKYLDDKINELKALKSRDELTDMGEDMLNEFIQIKIELNKAI